MAWGTALGGLMLLYGGEVVRSVVLLALESHILRDCDYEVYRLSPLDSVALRRALGGSLQRRLDALVPGCARPARTGTKSSSA